MATINVYYRQNCDLRTDTELNFTPTKLLGLTQSNYVLVGHFESEKNPSEIYRAFQFESKTDWEHTRYPSVARHFDAGGIDRLAMRVGDVIEIDESPIVVARMGFQPCYWK